MVGKAHRFTEFYCDILRSCHFLDTIVLAQALPADVTEVTDNRVRKIPIFCASGTVAVTVIRYMICTSSQVEVLYHIDIVACGAVCNRLLLTRIWKHAKTKSFGSPTKMTVCQCVALNLFVNNLGDCKTYWVLDKTVKQPVGPFKMSF